MGSVSGERVEVEWKLANAHEDVAASLGTRPHRLICSTRGDLLWFCGRRAVDVFQWNFGA